MCHWHWFPVLLGAELCLCAGIGGLAEAILQLTCLQEARLAASAGWEECAFGPFLLLHQLVLCCTDPPAPRVWWLQCQLPCQGSWSPVVSCKVMAEPSRISLFLWQTEWQSLCSLGTGGLGLAACCCCPVPCWLCLARGYVGAGHLSPGLPRGTASACCSRAVGFC